MSNTKNEEYQTPDCHAFPLELAGNVMSPKPEVGINPWEEGDEI